ncbi:MAG: ferrous iron transport protein B [Spirochaetes bacterium GWD1_61_31]|nr:MAG: ferrous iron transport protein B [Spirochaetes bacterium GWB1_60_80]OHD31275.1 MAG: ferrous iron transport protein B [Spirochaetes bacterium GWC1_61_12]OHD39457.1 MAG: ferrous iron transport protein B [Spirochaetes bacterium GWD1_61_31]OHD45510.1 MAG: ferrous iron transport protein B [Spirochaetes bacterium GWE1_60_18]OHD58084.1 MAG: ferrous iron transport protein B [Spirochaetes bacterium GWF1_60_12]HAP44653.1 ferrous iron transport protein B [Spirochaetaceae bacterium]
MKERLIVAIAGNPNCGKTTIFNAITGAHHKVGNYPGVTVEKREGHCRFRDRQLLVVDLPGTYSLTAYSPDEVAARDFLLNEKPDVVIDVMDSSNLERHLYLCLQFKELGVPVIGALNMADEAEAAGVQIDAAQLSRLMGIPLVRTVGSQDRGIEDLLQAALALADAVSPASLAEASRHQLNYGSELEERLAGLVALLQADTVFLARYPLRWLAIKLLEKDVDAYARLADHLQGAAVRRLAEESAHWLEQHFGRDAEIVVSEQRYAFVHGAVQETVTRRLVTRQTLTENIDKVLMNRLLGLPFFLLVMWGVFKLTFALGEAPVGWMDSLFGVLGGLAGRLLPEGLLRSLVVDGIIGGIGGVFSFVPLIIILFFLLSILEDTGYMARVAFITDKFLHIFGLHGQSFLPMILGFGCSVPAIMATRTLRGTRDRIVTALVVPFMSCGAKLPIYVLLAGAFFPANPAAAVMAIYGSGVALAFLSALLFKSTLLRGEATPFVMELPPYRSPTWRGLFWHVGEKTLTYIKKAGTVILLASVLIWAATNFPALPQTAQLKTLPPAEQARLSLEYSLAGRFGRVIEPLVRPLGFDWRIGVAAVTGFAAKEIVVSTLGVMYAQANSDDSGSLMGALRADPLFSPLVAFCLMLFMLIIPPCFATLATIRAELGWKWLGVSVAYLLILGWLVTFAVYNVGRLLAWGL